MNAAASASPERRDGPSGTQCATSWTSTARPLSHLSLGAGRATIYYTEVPRHLRGQGIGSIMVRGVLQDIRAKGLEGRPGCGFVAAFIRQNPEFHDLLG